MTRSHEQAAADRLDCLVKRSPSHVSLRIRHFAFRIAAPAAMNNAKCLMRNDAEPRTGRYRLPGLHGEEISVSFLIAHSTYRISHCSPGKRSESPGAMNNAKCLLRNDAEPRTGGYRLPGL